MKAFDSAHIAVIATLGVALGVVEMPLLQSQSVPKGTHLVKPADASNARPAGSLRIVNGQYFSYALPQGWRVGEDAQFALTLIAPDSKALTVMVGNSGLPPNYPPAQFAYQKLS